MQIAKQLLNEADHLALADPSKIPFGTLFSPHFLISEYRDGLWDSPRVETLREFSLHPGTLVFHYGQTVFEGLKAFREADGSVALFRPDRNAHRLNSSARRMGMPEIDVNSFLNGLQELVCTDQDLIPPYPGSLYIRPTMIATETCIGVRSSSEFVFFVLTLPSGSYFPDLAAGAGAVDVFVSESVIRAAPGGTGNVKTAANYAVTLKVTVEAKALGCAQVLFLDCSPERRVEEMGGMNIMFVDDGKLVTPPLNTTILAGITRDSIMCLARDLGIEVKEYAFSLKEMVDRLASGHITEALACGTAAVITGIRSFRFEGGEVLQVGSSSPGPISSRLFDALQDIQYGRTADRHGWLVPVTGENVLHARTS